jgi:capsular exopolysaccharide synthesis family protein
LAVVPAAAKRFHHGKEQLFMRTQATSTMAESIRLLRTNIEFAAAAKEISTLAVTSSEPGEGKSTITANLATGMAQTGFTVAVIDADMRRPNQHRIFGVANTTGLTTLLTRDTADWKSAATQVVDGLWLVASGPIPPNPADLLSSDRFRATVDTILASVDVVLIDTPPILVVSDPLVVATKTDATLLVSRSGATRIETLRRSANLLHQNGVRLIGVALNRETGRNAQGYYYYYDSDYYTNPDEPSLDASPIPRKPLTARADHAR